MSSAEVVIGALRANLLEMKETELGPHCRPAIFKQLSTEYIDDEL